MMVKKIGSLLKDILKNLNELEKAINKIGADFSKIKTEISLARVNVDTFKFYFLIEKIEEMNRDVSVLKKQLTRVQWKSLEEPILNLIILKKELEKIIQKEATESDVLFNELINILLTIKALIAENDRLLRKINMKDLVLENNRLRQRIDSTLIKLKLMQKSINGKKLTSIDPFRKLANEIRRTSHNLNAYPEIRKDLFAKRSKEKLSEEEMEVMEEVRSFNSKELNSLNNSMMEKLDELFDLVSDMVKK